MNSEKSRKLTANKSGDESGMETQDPYTIEPTVTSHTERAIALKEIVSNMRNNPLPESAPRLSRDDLHARR